ncbi:putative glycolipid-binding domain-containing protein [Spirillospora sp. NPDC048824]|uniref:putative glycolipid-binding domain-containing protein n=1 Tax=Spirillospora sp. NPDC048824 TaxID=3364526 RepID=UPI003720EA54
MPFNAPPGTAPWRHLEARDGRIEMETDGAGNWRVDGEPAPHIGGCLDVDLESAPRRRHPSHSAGRSAVDYAENAHSARMACHIKLAGPVSPFRRFQITISDRRTRVVHGGSGSRGVSNVGGACRGRQLQQIDFRGSAQNYHGGTQSLDNQWFDRELLERALREGGVGKAILREQAQRSRREYLRALLNAEKVVINRAFLYNNPQVYQDFASKGRDQDAFRDMLERGVIIPMLLSEDGPLPASGPQFQVTEGLQAWRRVAETTMMSCLRLSWDDTENMALAESVNKTFGAFLTGLVQFEVPALQRDFDLDEDAARSALARLKEVGRWVFDELDAGRPVVRHRVYEKFVVGEGGDVARRQYDARLPHLPVVKQLIDLKYATNLADAVDVFTLTPSNSLRRTALQEGLAHVRRRREGAAAESTDADELIRLLRNLAFDDVQGLLEAVPTLDHLSLAEIWQVRKEKEWHAYKTALAGVINTPSIDALADPDTGVVEICRAYLTMLNKAEEIRNDRSSGRLGGLTEIAIDIGALTVNVLYMPGDHFGYEVVGELAGLASTRLARVTLRLGLGRFRGNRSQHRIDTTAQLLDMRMEDPYREAKKLLEFLSAQGRALGGANDGADLSNEGE